MALEMMKSIHQAETEAEEIIKHAGEEARELMRKADEKIAALTLDFTEQGQLDARQKDSLAEKEAETAIESSEAENENICKEIRKTGEQNLDQATNLVVERIVNSLGNH